MRVTKLQPCRKTWVAIILAVAACRPLPPQHSNRGAEVEAYPFQRYIGVMVDEQKVLTDVSSSLVRGVTAKLAQIASATVRRATTRGILASEVVTLLSANPFLMKRDRLARVFEMLVDDTHAAACGGASCSEIFGFSKVQVQEVLDSILLEVANRPNGLESLSTVNRNAILYGLTVRFKSSEVMNAVLSQLPDRQHQFGYLFHSDLPHIQQLSLDGLELSISLNKDQLVTDALKELDRLPNLKKVTLSNFWAGRHEPRALLTETTIAKQATKASLYAPPPTRYFTGIDSALVSNILDLPKLESLSLSIHALSDLRGMTINPPKVTLRSVAFHVRTAPPKDGANKEWGLGPFLAGTPDRHPELSFAFNAAAEADDATRTELVLMRE